MEKEEKKKIMLQNIEIAVLSIIIVALLTLIIYMVFIKKDDNEGVDNKQNNNSYLEITGKYNDKQGNEIRIEEKDNKIIVYENEKFIFDMIKSENFLDNYDVVDSYVILSGGASGQTYEYALILNKSTGEVIKGVTKIGHIGEYNIYKVQDGYFFVFEGIVNNEAEYFYEAFSDKKEIINLTSLGKNDNGFDEYKSYVYGIFEKYMYFAEEKLVRNGKNDIRISQVDTDGIYKYSSYYESVMCIENNYALILKDNVMYLLDLEDNFKEYKIAEYKSDMLGGWHIAKQNDELYINNWFEEEDIVGYRFNINSYNVTIVK